MLVSAVAAVGVSAAAPEGDTTAALPLRRVVLFTSGVGYFEHGGEIDPARPVQFRFRPEEMVDVVRSLVVLDAGPGSVAAAVYDTREPAARTLRSLTPNLADNPALHLILQRLRGRRVTLTTVEGETAGRIVSVETYRVVRDEGTEEHHRVNLMTRAGLRRVELSEVKACRFADPDVNRDLQKALALLGAAGDRRHKALRLYFSGSRRRVRVGYLRETPVWKASYRLVKQGKKTLLQGWAHLENTTESDWESVAVVLTSGNPISFVQNLYDPVYVKRPEIPLAEEAALRPAAHEQVLDETARQKKSPAVRGLFAARKAELFSGVPPATPAPGMGAAGMLESMADTVTAALGERRGEVFVYKVKSPLTLGRNRGAMVPIVNVMVAAEWLTVVNPEVNRGIPLNCVVVSNNTGNFLKSGPVTVFEDGVYAGEGLLPDTARGVRQVISYAGDPRSVVDREDRSPRESIVKVAVRNGTLEASVRQEVVTLYTIRNQRDETRNYLVEHPVRRGWELVSPTGGVERTPDFYRFRVAVDAKSTELLEITEQRLLSRSFALSTLSSDQILYYISGREISPRVREALQKVASLQQEIKELKARIGDREQDLRRISREQSRIRENMRVLSRTDELFRRYLKKLSVQEDRADELEAELGRLRERLRGKQKELDDYLSGLSVE